MPRGIEDKRHLLQFFIAKNHHNLVLRAADLKEISLPAQYELIAILNKCLDFPALDVEPGLYFARHAAEDGYLILPLNQLLENADIPILRNLQLILFLYRDVRLRKGEPSRIDNCACQHTKNCQQCGGSGVITTYLEVAPFEEYLASRIGNAE